MERKTNISVWQLRLFEGFDRDVMVMQRDEQEVFDDALHVFFGREYYDAYVAKAAKYGTHRYAYHEDKLGEVINQVFDEKIAGLVLHISTVQDAPKDQLGDEKYIASKELISLKDAADSYHFLYTAAIDRCAREAAVARLWTKDVYIIGRLPDFRVKPKEGERPAFELMTMKRKKDGGTATAQDFDYESLKVFLTADSAMRFNPDKKPVSKYKLALLSQLVKGRFRVVIEPHRNYWIEYDPAALDLTGYLDIPRYTEEMVRARIQEYTRMGKIYILLSPVHSDYRVSLGNPFLLKVDDKNVMMYIFEKYEDAANYVLQNPAILPLLDSTFPIGVLDQADRMFGLAAVLDLADKLGVTGITLDADTLHAIGCKLAYFREAAGYSLGVEELLSAEELSKVMREEDGGKKYRMPAVPFYDRSNSYNITDERKAELLSHMDSDFDLGLAYLAGCSVPDMMVMLQEAAARFENARKAEEEADKAKYNKLLVGITVSLTEELCSMPYIYALREDNGDFAVKNNILYLVVTNRYEAGRKGDGKLVPAGIDNPQFMEKLCEAGRVAALTDGPGILCLVDTKLMGEAAKQWKKAEPLREELMIYLTQGCDLPYPEARYYYRRLKSDNSIFVEFASSVRNGAYPPMGMLTIEGYTAKELSEEYGLNMLQAYDSLLSLKGNPKYLEELNGSGGGKEEGSGGKRSFLGKIFKK